MPSKKFLELQDFSDTELVDQLKEVEKRDIARLKTEARKRQVAAMSPEQLAKRSKIRARRRKS